MPNWFINGCFRWHHLPTAEQITYLGAGMWLLPINVVMTVENLDAGEWLLHLDGEEWDVETTEHDPRF